MKKALYIFFACFVFVGAAFINIQALTAEQQQTSPIIESVKLVKVVDGDTIDVLMRGAVQRVRFYGVNTPERGHEGYHEAGQFLKDHLTEDLWLISEPSGQFERDAFCRIIAYVHLNPSMQDVNAMLISTGHSVMNRKYPCSRSDYYESLESDDSTK